MLLAKCSAVASLNDAVSMCGLQWWKNAMTTDEECIGA
jgi:hypothetical protein